MDAGTRRLVFGRVRMARQPRSLERRPGTRRRPQRGRSESRRTEATPPTRRDPVIATMTHGRVDEALGSRSPVATAQRCSGRSRRRPPTRPRWKSDKDSQGDLGADVELMVLVVVTATIFVGPSRPGWSGRPDGPDRVHAGRGVAGRGRPGRRPVWPGAAQAAGGDHLGLGAVLRRRPRPIQDSSRHRPLRPAARRRAALPCCRLGAGRCGSSRVLGVWLALLVGAALAPTDAALGLPVVTNPAVPARIRQLITVESGLNDGIATPVVMFAIAGAAAAAGLEAPRVPEAPPSSCHRRAVGAAIGRRRWLLRGPAGTGLGRRGVRRHRGAGPRLLAYTGALARRQRLRRRLLRRPGLRRVAGSAGPPNSSSSSRPAAWCPCSSGSPSAPSPSPS